jgi:glycosyltransferase involved in cell wall biosynthesis
MRVCVVTTWPPHRDGIAYYSWKLYTEVEKHANVTIIANRASELNKQNQARASARVIRCWQRHSFILFPQIFRESAKNQGDIIHVQHGWLLYGDPLVSAFFPLLLLMLRLFSKPVITTMHSVISTGAISKSLAENFVLKILSKPVVLSITKLIGRLSSNIIVHNVLMKEVLIKEYNLNPSKIIVIHHGVEEARIFEVEPNSNSIMFFGHLRPMKGIENLLQAFQMLSEKNHDAKLFIVGSPHAHDKPDYMKNLQNKIMEIGTKVTLETFVSENRLSQLIAASEIIVLPYLDDGFIEASGALARVIDYEKAVVCTNIPKFRGELDESECVFVKPDDATGLAEALDLLLSNARLRREKAKRLKKLAKTRYWNVVAEEHVKFYESFLSDKKTV